MSRKIIFPNKIILIITITVTTFLIVGSAWLSQIVYKADEPSVSTTLIADTESVKPLQEFKIHISSDIIAPSLLTGAQFSVSFDPKQLSYVGFENSSSWKSQILSNSPGQIILLTLPQNLRSFQTDVGSNIVFSNLIFKGQGNGQAKVSLLPNKSIVAALTDGQVVNILSTTQDVLVSVTDQGGRLSSNPVETESKDAFEDEKISYRSQRIISDEQLVSYDSAIIFVRLQQKARIKVAYGQDNKLLNTVESATYADNATLRLSGLKNSKTYFYQVIAINENQTSKVASEVKSFTLGSKSELALVDRTEIKIFPPNSTTDSTAYVQFFDSTSKIVTNINPTIRLSKGGGSSALVENNGIFQASLFPSGSDKKIVTITVSNDDKDLASSKFIFKPKVVDSTDDSTSFPRLIKSQQTTNIITILLVTLLLIGLMLRKVLHLK